MERRENEYNGIWRRGGFRARAFSDRTISIFLKTLPPVPPDEVPMVTEMLENALKNVRNRQSSLGPDEQEKLDRIKKQGQSPEDNLS